MGNDAGQAAFGNRFSGISLALLGECSTVTPSANLPDDSPSGLEVKFCVALSCV